MPSLIAAKARAKKEGLPFDLTKEWAEKMWDGKCAVCSLPFNLKEKRHALSPSIDKIKPGLGYTKNNSRFIAWAINRFKGEEPDDSWIFVIAKAMASIA